jgi:hypothetical protein
MTCDWSAREGTRVELIVLNTVTQTLSLYWLSYPFYSNFRFMMYSAIIDSTTLNIKYLSSETGP